jgi:hypothetical protein
MGDPGSQAVGEASSARHREQWWGVLVAGIVVVPFVAFLVWALTTTIHSGGDIALTEIAVRDVGSAHTPLLGAYSRYGWHHPGPGFFYALAVPYRVLGRDGSALAAGAVLVNALAIGGSIVMLWRRGRLGGLVIGGLAIAVLVHSLGGVVLASAWNPVATVVPMLLFVLAVWSVTCGDVWMLPVVVGIGSLVVQTHVGTAAVVVVGALTAGVTVFVSRRARGGDGRLWIVSAAVGVVLWIPPIADALAHGGGNLRALFRFWTAAHDHLTGWARAARIVGAELALDPPWITGRLPRQGFVPGVDPGWTFPALAVVFVIALVVAARRAHRDAFRLGAVTIGFTFVAWVSVARIVDEPFDYLVRWTEITGALVWLTVGWTVLEVVRGVESVRARRTVGSVGALLVAVMLAFTVVTSVRAFDDPPALGEQRIYDRIAPQLRRVGPTLSAPVVVADTGTMSSAGLGSSVVNGLLDAGVDARLPSGFAWKVGGAHVVARARARTRLLVAYGDESEQLRTDPRYRVVAVADELDPARRAELEHLQASFSGFEGQIRWTRRHPALARRLTELARHSAQAVVLVERG